MTDKPTSKAFIKLPLELLTSDAWRSLSINARRFIDFVMIEHMRHGGKANGALLAPRRQLEQIGIGARYISAAIEEAVRGGLVNCRPGTGRQPSLYALTWLPLGDGITVATSQGIPLGYPKGSHKARSNFPREVTKPQNKGIRREVTLKKASYRKASRVRTYQERASEEGSALVEQARCPWHVMNGSGLTICGKPIEPGKDRCVEHGADGAIH